jgi:hypothetical protein
MPRKEPRAYIPKDVRRDLWIAAAGRCEFRGCCKPVDRDFLTKEKCVVGEYAHIIADSPDGARGVEGESERLAKDPTNLMLSCRDCHGRIDRRGKNNQFTVDQLHAMKREHEARIQLIYSANGVKDSLPILMTFPVGSHVPVIERSQIHYAMLENSGYTRFPVDKVIHIDRGDFDIFDDSLDFWPFAERTLSSLYKQRILPELTSRNGPPHLTIAALAPIPMLMKLGSLIGDKTEATVLDLPSERWLWDKHVDCPEPSFIFRVPDKLPREVAAVISISNRADHPASPNVVEFLAVEPNRGIIRQEKHVNVFRQQFNAFLMQLARSGVRILHLYPATPISASVEIGRMLLPKTFEEIHVWEWQAPTWKPAVRLK